MVLKSGSNPYNIWKEKEKRYANQQNQPLQLWRNQFLFGWIPSIERFPQMSQRYEAEQAGLADKIKTLRKDLDKLSSEAVSTDMFLSTVRKYTRAKKADAPYGKRADRSH